MAFQSIYSLKEVGNWNFQVDMSRGGHPFSLQRKIKAKTMRGQATETRNAPGGPRNSYSVVLGLSSDWEGLDFLEVIVGGMSVMVMVTRRFEESLSRLAFQGLVEIGIGWFFRKIGVMSFISTNSVILSPAQCHLRSLQG
jgi:hypothetical protein